MSFFNSWFPSPFPRLFLMRIIDIPYLNITGPDCKLIKPWIPLSFSIVSYVCVIFVQCNPRETTFFMWPFQRNGRRVTCTSSLVPLVRRAQKCYAPLEASIIDLTLFLCREHSGVLDRRDICFCVFKSNRSGSNRYVLADLHYKYPQTESINRSNLCSNEHKPLRRELPDSDVRRVHPRETAEGGKARTNFQVMGGGRLDETPVPLLHSGVWIPQVSLRCWTPHLLPIPSSSGE